MKTTKKRIQKKSRPNKTRKRNVKQKSRKATKTHKRKYRNKKYTGEGGNDDKDETGLNETVSDETDPYENEFGFGVKSSNKNSSRLNHQCDNLISELESLKSSQSGMIDKKKLVESFSKILKQADENMVQSIKREESNIEVLKNADINKSYEDLNVMNDILSKMITEKIGEMENYESLNDKKFIDMLHAIPSLIFKKISEVNALLQKLQEMIRKESQNKYKKTNKSLLGRFRTIGKNEILSKLKIIQIIKGINKRLTVEEAASIASEIFDNNNNITETEVKDILKKKYNLELINL
jgi:hypothetical protein